MPTKIVSVSPTGRIRKTTAFAPSTHSRIQQLIRELGIDREIHNFKTSIQKYTRLSHNQHLGINS
jgi:hypothetical protein